MIGKLFINDKDAWTTWGVFLADGSYEKLLLPAPMKDYSSNKFRSQSGKQVFVFNPRFDERDVQIEFNVSASNRIEYLQRFGEFITELSSGLIVLKVIELNKEYKFLYVSSIGLSYYERLGKLAVRFNEPGNSVEPIFEVLATEDFQFLLTEDGKTIII